MNRIILADNLDVLPTFPDESFSLIYIDPPFNTGRVQSRTQLKTVRDDAGDRTGFQGARYRSEAIGTHGYDDAFDDYLAFLRPRLEQAHRLLTQTGSLFVHLDAHEVHYAKVMLDGIFGRQHFINEIIWAYDYGGRPKNRWPAKHGTILWYAADPGAYTFNFDAIDRIPYMAPGLVGPEKAERGKTPTDVWWHTIVPTNGKEKTGYPTQKPFGVLNRLIRVHSNPGDTMLDFFAGSGTTGDAAARNGREFTLLDSSLEAAQIMSRRLAFARPECVGFVAESSGEPEPLELFPR